MLLQFQFHITSLSGPNGTNVQDHDHDQDKTTTKWPNQNSSTTSQQPNLQALARPNLKDLGGMEDSNGTVAHGSFHQNPKFLLSVTISPQKEEQKVEHPMENSDRNQNLHTMDQPTLVRLCRARLDDLEDMEGRDGISTLGSFHQDIRRPFPNTRSQQEDGWKVAQSHEILTATCRGCFLFCFQIIAHDLHMY